jgi:sugar lactone lactonase YvrE
MPADPPVCHRAVNLRVRRSPARRLSSSARQPSRAPCSSGSPRRPIAPTFRSDGRLPGDFFAAEDLLFPNGSVVTSDGQTLIVGETAGARYSAFTIRQDGSLIDRRIWAQVAPTPEFATLEQTLARLQFGPDGCTLDAEGHIWAADEVGARCVRLAPGGEIVDEIAAPAGLDFFACMLGGQDGRTLLICAAPDFAEANRTAEHEAVLFTTTVDVPHAGLP